ncbi:hypothetical protein QYF36_013762 [Acer negundo]|nr:hypothetical protein QYF36_013762 [Acer negundo]
MPLESPTPGHSPSQNTSPYLRSFLSSDSAKEVVECRSSSDINFWRLKPLRSTDSAAELKVSSTGQNFRNETLVELLRKCLLVPATDNKMLMDSALLLAQLNLLIWQEDSFREAAKKMKEAQVGYELDYEDVFRARGAAKDRLMIGGVWKKVGERATGH